MLRAVQVLRIFRGMEAAARQLIPLRTALFVADMDAKRRLWWLRTVAEFSANQGVRPLLSHVPPADWIRHYAANEDAYSAVTAELARVD